MNTENTEIGTENSNETEMVGIPRAVLDHLLNRVDSLENELSEYRETNERDKATIRRDVTEAISKAESGTNAESDEKDEKDDRGDSMTPMERLLRFGQEGVTIDMTATPRRAKAIVEHFGQWADKTPAGLVVTDGLKKMLETATGERLEWSQVHRAGAAVAEFTRGAIAWRKTKKGWTLVAQPDDHRLQSLLSSRG